MTLAFIALARPTFDVPFASSQAQQVYQRLQASGLPVLGTPDLAMSLEEVQAVIKGFDDQPIDMLLILQASFADSTMALHLAEQVNAPLLLWAVPEEKVGGRLRLNSFCGINLAGHALRRAGYQYEYIYAPPDDNQALRKVQAMAQAGMVYRRLRQTRIGRVGEPPDGFDTCRVTPATLEKLGVELVQLPLEAVFEGARQPDPTALASVYQRMSGQVAGLADLDQSAVHGTLGSYLTLRRMAAEQALDGFAVRCWPQFFTDLGCAACASSALLNGEMLPASCEADTNGTITQLILQWLSQSPVVDMDMVDFDLANDSTVLWHCGKAPLAMADGQVHGTIHSNRKMPLLLEFTLKPGRVTLARLSEAEGTLRLVIGTGEIIAAPPAFTGTSGTIRFDRGTAHALETVMQAGLEHHVALAYGDYQDSLSALANLLEIPVLWL
jgi:L-fucose isomerase-like protein